VKFNSYLLKEGRTQIIRQNQFILDVVKKCSKIVNIYKKTNIYYFRGIEDFNSNYGFVQPSKFTRESAFASRNTYTVLLDNLPSWKDYPKRSKSIIMTTDLNEALSRGGSYAVFPVDNANIGICPSYDIWFSFPLLAKRFHLEGLDDFIRFMYKINMYIGKSKYDIDKWEDLKKLLSIVPNADNINHWGFNNKETLYDQIIPYLDPKKNGFKIISTNKMIKSKNRECWTDANCYLLSSFDLMHFIKEVF